MKQQRWVMTQQRYEATTLWSNNAYAMINIKKKLLNTYNDAIKKILVDISKSNLKKPKFKLYSKSIIFNRGWGMPSIENSCTGKRTSRSLNRSPNFWTPFPVPFAPEKMNVVHAIVRDKWTPFWTPFVWTPFFKGLVFCVTIHILRRWDKNE